MTQRAARGELAGLLVFSLFWNAFVGVFIAIGLGIDLGGSYLGPEPGSVTFWLVLTPFILVGLGTLSYVIFKAFGKQEWRVGADLLEQRAELFGQQWVRRTSDARLRVTIRHRSEDGSTDVLELEAGGKPRVLYAGPGNTALAAYLVQQTGWPLELPREYERWRPAFQRTEETFVRPAAVARAAGEGALVLTEGWRAGPQTDGSVVMARTGHPLAAVGAVLLGFSFFWNGILAWGYVNVLAHFVLEGMWWVALFPLPFVLIGIGLAGFGLYCLFGRETWRAGPDCRLSRHRGGAGLPGILGDAAS
jgi:hypothetical protein